MKRRFITKKSRKRFTILKIIIVLLLFIFSLVLSFCLLNRSNIKINDKYLVQILLKDDTTIFDNIISLTIKDLFESPAILLDNDYFKSERVIHNDENVINVSKEPMIYIYNSHQSEEYAFSNFAEFSVRPTVMFVDYLLQEIFNKNNYYSIVEEASIKDILNTYGWKYSYSYRASRVLLESARENNPSLKYYIDVHRDSLDKGRTTIEIAGKTYAKTIFLIGLENENYQENLTFTEKINNLMNTKYPGLSKGIYKKAGEGVNGVYNQDFSNRTILIEIGGYENTPSEVLNSVLAFSECFMEVIKNDEG